MPARVRREPLVFLAGVVFDQAVKFLSSEQLNRGVAFSLGRDYPSRWLTAGLAAFALLAWLISWPRVKTDPVLRLCHALFFAGAFSNLLDRILFGGVRDIWSVPLLGIRNNLADWLIVTAAAGGALWQISRSWRETPSGNKIPT